MVSISYFEIINDIKNKEQQGYREVVLSGVNIGKYKSKKIDLVQLIQKILSETNIKRIRFGSVNPDHVSDRFIKLFENERICNHLHLSLQSGSDSVLKRMNRKYNSKEYLDTTNKFYSKYPDFNFTTDVIVGFPSESNKEFRETSEFIKRIKFSKVHIFPYSRREGTVACNMKGQIKNELKRKRLNDLKKINDKLIEAFNEKMINRSEEVLFEGEKKDIYSGFTKNYFKVKLKSNKNIKNQLKIIKIKKNNLTI